MATIFPQTLIPSTPFTSAQIWRTLITQTETGKEYRRKKWSRPKRTVRIVYNRRELDKINDFWNFYTERNGALEDFIFIYPHEETWKNEYIGRGDGSTTIFKLPIWYGWTSLTVYIDGSVTTNYTITSYANDRPDIVFNSAPSAGSLITCDFTGKLAIIMRFQEDNLSKDILYAKLSTIGINLIEVI